jgi:nucleoside-diphosphate-sugar epimerase
MPGLYSDLPDVIANEAELVELLSRPSPAVIGMLKRLDGDIMLLGISGKIGPELGLMAVRAIKEAGSNGKVFGVSRFSEDDARERFADMDIELIKCDLMEPDDVNALPRVKNIIYLAGRKFGTHGSEELTWVANAVVPASVAKHFRDSRIVAFSTGAVYPMVTPSSGGCVEEDALIPIGEYAQSCVGRERVFTHYSKANGTPMSLIRLNYAVDLRYGVLYDIGKLVMESKSVNVKMGYFNVIWQGDVNNQTLILLDHCASPPSVWNMTRPGVVSTREVAGEFAKIMGKEATFTSEESPTAFLSNPAKAVDILGAPMVSLDKLIHYQAHWLMAGGRSLDKPTHFEETGGKY